MLRMSYCDCTVSSLHHPVSTFYLVYSPHFQSDIHETWLTCLFQRYLVGQFMSKSRSQSHILEKPCIRLTGHIFTPILMKLGHNVCLNEISDELENGSFWVKI